MSSPPEPLKYSFYRLSTIGWANPLLRQTLSLFGDDNPEEVLVDLSDVEFFDSFGITYLAACLERWRTHERMKLFIRPPKRLNVNQHLQNVGFYEAIGLEEKFEARQPNKNRVDLVHIQTLEPLFVDGLLDFLESIQPFSPGLRPSIRMALYELIQNFADHAESTTGAWIAGQKHQKGNRLALCVLDLGRGIPTRLRGVQKYRRMKDPHLIELATEDGVSSVANGRGRGLTMIRRFVRANEGAMTIIAGGGRADFGQIVNQ